MSEQSQSASKRGGVRPGAGRPEGSVGPRRARLLRRRALIAAYSDALGGDAALSEPQKADIKKAAELTALNVLGTIQRELGGLDGIACWLKINGYVNAVDGFTEQARVINGFSDLILDLYGEERLAARTSVGVPHLPFDMPVEVDAIIALS